MKKRSLVAAIAMLLVSAIVLTSATYAWFTAQTIARVETISATVTNASGNLQLTPNQSASSLEPKPATVLYAADFDVTNTLQPVSMSYNPTGHSDTDPFFAKVGYDGIGYLGCKTTSATDKAELAAIANPTAADKKPYPIVNEDYIYYGFDVSYVNEGTTDQVVRLEPTFSANNGTFTYAVVKITTDIGTADEESRYYMFNTSGSYTPVIALPTPAQVSNGTTYSILDDDISNKAYIAGTDKGFLNNTTYMSDYSGCTLWSNVTAESGHKYIKFDAPAKATADDDPVTSEANVEVWIWAEGQDADCTGTVSGDATAIAFACDVANAS